MELFMQTPYDSYFKKRLFFRLILSVFIIFSVYSWLLTTVYVKTISDINFMIPILIDIIPYITDITEIAGILICYSFIIYAFCRFDKNTVFKYVTAFVLLTIYKYLAKIAITYIMNGALPQIKGMFIDLMYSVAIPASLEYLQAAIFIFIAYFIFKGTFEYIETKKKLENKIPNFKFDEKSVFFPFSKLLTFKNPIQRTAFWSGIIIMISKMAQLLIIDFSVGLPTDLIDFFWIIISYISCVLLGSASYLFILWIMISLNNYDIKLKYTFK